MDTREKIVPLKDLTSRLGSAHWLAVAGLFDPLTLPQASRLAQATEPGRSILAIIEPGTAPLLPAEARASLVAALRSVTLVTIAEPATWRALLAHHHPRVEIVEDPAGERQRSAEFKQLIASRQGAR